MWIAEGELRSYPWSYIHVLSILNYIRKPKGVIEVIKKLGPKSSDTEAFDHSKPQLHC
jgi:hypothetical protein